MTESDRMALIANEERRYVRPTATAISAVPHTAFSGVLVTGCTCFQMREKGTPSSRE